jgi:hypothetical protein
LELATELEASLRDLGSAGSVELRENGDRVAVFTALSWEVRGAAQKPLLHLWSEQHNLTRRVLAITDHSDQGLALAVERFGRTRPGRLEFLRLEFDPSARDLSREQSCARLGRILSDQFPEETLESLTSAQDLEHSLSGNYARGFLRKGSTRWAVLGVLDDTSSEGAENCLTFGLLWLDRAQQSSHRGVVAGLRLIVPKGAWRVLVHRLQALNPEINPELYELEPQCERLERSDPRSAGNINTWLVPKARIAVPPRSGEPGDRSARSSGSRRYHCASCCAIPPGAVALARLGIRSVG